MLQQPPPSYNFAITRPHQLPLPSKNIINRIPSILIGKHFVIMSSPFPPYGHVTNNMIDFTAMTLCDLIKTRNSHHKKTRSLPEFVFFVQKVTHQANINVRTLLVALIYLKRAKSNLPKRAIGSDGRQ